MHAQWPTENEPGLIFTKNRRGSMFTDLSPASKAFIEFAKKCEHGIADIGCAYGVATLPAVAASHCDVHAVDLSPEHLEVLSSCLHLQDQQRVQLHTGRLPDDIDFPAASLDAIHASCVLHFLRGKPLLSSLHAFKRWLRPTGQLFLNVVSVHHRMFTEFLPIYQDRHRAGVEWPGELDALTHFESKAHHVVLPDDDFLHLFSLEQLVNILAEVGFETLHTGYYDYASLEAPANPRGHIHLTAVLP